MGDGNALSALWVSPGNWDAFFRNLPSCKKRNGAIVSFDATGIPGIGIFSFDFIIAIGALVFEGWFRYF